MNKSIFNQVLDIAVYGVEWVEYCEGSEDYKSGALEGTAFIIACSICQNCNFHDGLPTSDVVEALNLFSYPDKIQLKKSLEELFVSLGWNAFSITKI